MTSVSVNFRNSTGGPPALRAVRTALGEVLARRAGHQQRRARLRHGGREREVLHLHLAGARPGADGRWARMCLAPGPGDDLDLAPVLGVGALPGDAVDLQEVVDRHVESTVCAATPAGQGQCIIRVTWATRRTRRRRGAVNQRRRRSSSATGDGRPPGTRDASTTTWSSTSAASASSWTSPWSRGSTTPSRSTARSAGAAR